MEIIGDFVFETCRGIDLPLQELLLEPIASNLTQSLKIKKKNTKPKIKIKNKETQSKIFIKRKTEIAQESASEIVLRVKLGQTLRPEAEELVMLFL